MRNHIFAAMAFAFALGPGTATSPRVATAADQAQEVIAGEVTKIDLEHGRVTVLSSDGKPHEFEASAETLKDLKVGDHIEAKRRPEPDQ